MQTRPRQFAILNSLLPLLALLLALAPLPTQAQSFFGGEFGGGETLTTLAIKPDGACLLTQETVQPRQSLLLQVKSWERYAKMAEGATPDEAANPPPAPASKPDEKAPADDELAAKIREMYRQRPDFGEDTILKLEKVDGSTNSLRVVTTRSFPSLPDLLSQSPWSWGPTVLMFENARFELDTNRNFRLTFVPSKEAARYGATMSRQWKSARMKSEWKLVLPGKILASGLPGTQTNATWLRLDGDKPETIDAALKLLGTPIVITAEAAGLKLEAPLESKTLARTAWRQAQQEPELPVTDAGPGFLAEPVSVTLSTLYYFPEGEKLFKKGTASAFGLEAPGTLVTAKLFPPKGRIIKSVSELKVTQAKDDQGRPIPGPRVGDNPADEESAAEYVFSSSGDETGGAARIELRLGLPASDAQTIEQLDAEAIALTLSGWKELALTNVQADAKKDIDLTELLPGARLTIKKVTARRPQMSVEAVLEGPPAISQLDVKIKLSGRNSGSSNLSDRRSSVTAAKTTRNLTVQAYEFAPHAQSAADDRPITLLVRYPQDLKRERVRIKLAALDLL